MDEEIFFRVRMPDRKEIALNYLVKYFSLRKVMRVEGRAFLILLLLSVFVEGFTWWSGGTVEIETLPVDLLICLLGTMIVFAIHLWVMLSQMLPLALMKRQAQDLKPDDGQILFMRGRFRVKVSGYVWEIPYGAVQHVKETSVDFTLDCPEDRQFFLINRKKFLEGDPAAFSAFIKNPPPEAEHSISAESESSQAAVLFQTGTELREDVYVRTSVQESICVHESMSPAAYWRMALQFALTYFLPIMVLCSFPSLLVTDSLSEKVFMLIGPIAVLVFMFCVLRIRKGSAVDTYRKRAQNEFQTKIKRNDEMAGWEYLFLEDSFQVIRGEKRWVYQYRDIYRMYSLKGLLVLVVGLPAAMRALPLDPQVLGEDCRSLMTFLEKMSGQEWEESLV